jgi:hypothetical protein
MTSGASKSLVVGCTLLGILSLVAAFRTGNTVGMVAAAVVFLGAALFFWRRRDSS